MPSSGLSGQPIEAGTRGEQPADEAALHGSWHPPQRATGRYGQAPATPAAHDAGGFGLRGTAMLARCHFNRSAHHSNHHADAACQRPGATRPFAWQRHRAPRAHMPRRSDRNRSVSLRLMSLSAAGPGACRPGASAAGTATPAGVGAGTFRSPCRGDRCRLWQRAVRPAAARPFMLLLMRMIRIKLIIQTIPGPCRREGRTLRSGGCASTVVPRSPRRRNVHHD